MSVVGLTQHDPRLLSEPIQFPVFVVGGTPLQTTTARLYSIYDRPDPSQPIRWP